MIKLKSIIEESTFDDVLSKWTPEASEDDIYKYINMFKTLKSRNIIKGIHSDISPWVKRSFDDFKEFVDNKILSYKEQDQFKTTSKDIDRIFENNVVLVISPNTHEASQKYGAHTKWCTSGRDRKSWDEWIDRGGKFYFILPKNNKKKFAVVVSPDGSVKQLYDDTNNELNISKLQEITTKYKIPLKLFSQSDSFWAKWIKKHKHKIRSDGKIDIYNDVNISGFNIETFPIKFGIIMGNFLCYSNNLISLKNGPERVDGNFMCLDNKLTSLQYAPTNVQGTFDCSSNKKQFTETEIRGVCNVQGEIRV